MLYKGERFILLILIRLVGFISVVSKKLGSILVIIFVIMEFVCIDIFFKYFMMI